MPKIVDETVRVAKKFLEDHPEEAEKLGDMSKIKHDTSMGVSFISRFLNWPEYRVSNSLERLHMIADNKIDREAINNLPTERAARDFVKAVKEFNLPIEKQKKAVEQILETSRGERELVCHGRADHPEEMPVSMETS